MIFITDKISIANSADVLFEEFFSKQPIDVIMLVAIENYLPSVLYKRIQVVKMGVMDAQEPPEEWFEDVATEAIIHLRLGKSVSFICAAGISRSPTACAATLCKLSDFVIGPDSALDVIKLKHGAARPHSLMLKGLKRWAKHDTT